MPQRACSPSSTRRGPALPALTVGELLNRSNHLDKSTELAYAPTIACLVRRGVPAMSAEDNKAIVRQVVDAGNAGDVVAFRALFADNFVHHDPAIRDLSGFLQFLGAIHAGVPDGHTTIEDMVAEGSEV